MRVGQLSTMAGAMVERWMSASDWVANTTPTFFLRRRLQPLADARREHRIVQEDPGLIQHQQRRPTIEPRLQAVEQVGQDRQHHALGVEQVPHLEGLETGEGEPVIVCVEQAPEWPFQRVGL